MKKTLFLVLVLTAAAFASASAYARDEIRIVGSSTVYPFASYVAEELGATTNFKTPVIEATGSGGGHKLFSAGADLDTPDMTNSSRQMEKTEFKRNMSAGNKNICEVKIGYDGIVMAFSADEPGINLRKKVLFLAVAAEVPQGRKLIPNPYKYWNEIDHALPHRKIIIYGPPTTSGTRDAFEELVMKKASKDMPQYGGKPYKIIRSDGAYVPAGENDNLTVQKLTKDKDAFGIFGYSFLDQNSDKIKAATIDGVAPTFKSIAEHKYPVSRSLYFYVKMSHMGKIPGMQQYVDLFLTERMIGDKGLLKRIGLIPLTPQERDSVRADWKRHKLLKESDLAN